MDTNIADTRKAFASQDEPVFLLTASQIQEIVQDALKREISGLREELSALREDIALERALDRQRIAELERGSIQPMQADRGEILRALLAANGGKMLAKDARQKMHLSKQTFSMLLAAMSEYIEKKPLHSDKRKDVLLLK